jgi:hypothetical protein
VDRLHLSYTQIQWIRAQEVNYCSIKLKFDTTEQISLIKSDKRSILTCRNRNNQNHYTVSLTLFNSIWYFSFQIW